jgi:hypothetical protein
LKTKVYRKNGRTVVENLVREENTTLRKELKTKQAEIDTMRQYILDNHQTPTARVSILKSWDTYCGEDLEELGEVTRTREEGLFENGSRSRSPAMF